MVVRLHIALEFGINTIYDLMDERICQLRQLVTLYYIECCYHYSSLFHGVNKTSE